MEIKSDFDFRRLQDNCWSGAIDTLITVYNNDKEDELMSLLEMEFEYDIPTLTEVNDFLWFEDEYIFEQLGISDEDEDDDYNEDEEDNDDVEEE